MHTQLQSYSTLSLPHQPLRVTPIGLALPVKQHSPDLRTISFLPSHYLLVILLNEGDVPMDECIIYCHLNCQQKVVVFYYNLYSMSLSHLSLLALLLLCAAASPVDFLLGQEYHGQYVATQPGKTFDYLDERAGQITLIFYGSPNREVLNSVEMLLLDPKYEDGKAVLLDIKGVVQIKEGKWANEGHNISIVRLWREREEDPERMDNVNTTIQLANIENEDYDAVTIKISMQGESFSFTAELVYYNQLISTMAYSLFVSAVVGLQILCAYRLLRVMDAPNFVFTAKFSLLAVSLCNIEDFSSTMTNIQSIMSSTSGYLFFILPSLAYIVLFIIFDMKMLFLIWRSQNINNLDNPQLIRKKLTAFYIQFYLGLFIYLTLTYFFANEEWMIMLRTLILLPQLVHNVRLAHKSDFTPDYIFGYVGARLLLPLYERSCPANRFHLTPNISLVLGIFAAYAIEVVLLALQHKLGSRFFVPKRFLPHYYEYKMKIKANEETRELDCSICLQSLFQSMSNGAPTLNDSLGEQMMGETTVMNTPCNHKFHQQCLSQWMEVKLECPTCRAALPAV